MISGEKLMINLGNPAKLIKILLAKKKSVVYVSEVPSCDLEFCIPSSMLFGDTPRYSCLCIRGLTFMLNYLISRNECLYYK